MDIEDIINEEYHPTIDDILATDWEEVENEDKTSKEDMEAKG